MPNCYRWRSFWIILIGSALLMLFKMKKLGKEYMIAGIAVLCLVDMWMKNECSCDIKKGRGKNDQSRRCLDF